ncbi:MAG: hypothetical protein GY795_38285 [Desulfobacterales bacterium]|nr:hypothetical protein [Desulfobacterales bacterium]
MTGHAQMKIRQPRRYQSPAGFAADNITGLTWECKRQLRLSFALLTDHYVKSSGYVPEKQDQQNPVESGKLLYNNRNGRLVFAIGIMERI